MNQYTKQFYLDVKRLDLYLDSNDICDKEPEYIKEYLFTKLNEIEASVAIYTLTQTFLADYYIKEFKKLILRDLQLLDHKRYIVYIDTKNKLIYISKDFKVVYFSENMIDYIIDYCTLNILVNLETFESLYSWNYDFLIDEPLIIERIFITLPLS